MAVLKLILAQPKEPRAGEQRRNSFNPPYLDCVAESSDREGANCGEGWGGWRSREGGLEGGERRETRGGSWGGIEAREVRESIEGGDGKKHREKREGREDFCSQGRRESMGSMGGTGLLIEHVSQLTQPGCRWNRAAPAPAPAPAPALAPAPDSPSARYTGSKPPLSVGPLV